MSIAFHDLITYDLNENLTFSQRKKYFVLS